MQTSTTNSTDEKLYQRLIQSCILNGVFLYTCILIFNYILMPTLNWIAFKLINESSHNLITDYLNPIIQLLFSFVWILPVFLLSKIFNLLCHQEIADIAYTKKYGKPQIYKNSSLAEVLADTIFSCSMELIFLVQSSFMTLMPALWLNKILCHIHLSFLYSLYAFEYKFCNHGWDIKKRIAHIESRWPYYFGFGLSLSLILSITHSYFYNATLFASLFPAFILSAIESDSEELAPITYLKQNPAYVNGVQQTQLNVPLFRLAIRATDVLFKAFAKKKSAGAKASQQPRLPASFTIRKTN
jgi:etoposide-induced 2.4 mRNA